MSHATSLSNHNPSNYNTHADFVYSAAYTAPVLSLLDAKPGEKIIDLGCGTGELTEQISKIVGPEGTVVGLDSSESMLVKARAKSTNPSIKYIQGDIQKLYQTQNPALQGQFDAVFSSATFHWCKADPGGVVETIKWLLKPGGRVAFEFGGFGNTVGVRAAIHQVLKKEGVDPVPLDPWYFPTVAQYTSLLQSHGLTPVSLNLVPRPTPLTTTLHGWLLTFARNTFFANFDDAAADRLLKEVQEICRPDNYWSNDTPGIGLVSGAGSDHDAPRGKGEEGWEVMYVRLRGNATFSPA